MGRWYCFFRRVSRYWFWWVVGLVVATTVFGLIGLARDHPDHDLATRTYDVVLLFALNCGDASRPVSWPLNVARWLGFAVWFVTVVSVLVRLFGQRVLAWYVRTWAAFRPGHVVVAGLGRPDAEIDRLVERLRTSGRDVVVVEPDPDHPGLDACRQAGAVCLTGSPLEPLALHKAQLARAGTFLALGEDDRDNVSVLHLAAAETSRPAPAPAMPPASDPLAPTPPGALDCVVQVAEPRLLDILRRHDLHRADRLRVRVFNAHELVARAMLRECLIGVTCPVLDKALVLGTGGGGRLGEALVLRAAKDRWIDRDPAVAFRPLEVDVWDPAAHNWTENLMSGLGAAAAGLFTVTPTACDAHRRGFRADDVRARLASAGYHAAFVALDDEGDALVQAVRLREVLPETVPIVVAVREEAAGFGELLSRPTGGTLGRNIHAVGLQDQVFGLAASMNPAVEVFAQALHQDYLRLTHQRFLAAWHRGEIEEAKKIVAKKAFVRWAALADDLKESNRLLAARLRGYFRAPSTGTVYRPDPRPLDVLDPGTRYRLSGDDVESLARMEHDGWMAGMLSLGWKLGSGADPHSSDPVRKLNPNLVPWDKLNPGMKDYDRNIIRRLPFVFAKADYDVVEVEG